MDLKVAAFVCLGFLLGGLIGAKIAVGVPSQILERVFGGALIAIGFKVIIGK